MVTRIGLLGPLEIHDAAGAVQPAGGPMLRALLARLAMDAGQAVRSDSIIDALWPDDAPAGAANALQSLVSRLRRLLSEGAGEALSVTAVPGSYRLDLSPDECDLFQFANGLTRARDLQAAGQYEAAAREFRAALELWRGDAFADVDAPFAAAEQQRLGSDRLAAYEDWLELERGCGRSSASFSDVQRLAAENPLRERLQALLILSLSDAGRQAEALAAYDRTRTRLADELGVDPSPGLQNAHLSVLRGEPAPAAAPLTAGPARLPRLRAHLTSFLGRESDVKHLLDETARSRLVTISGPGGAGKTRLAVEVASRLLHGFDGSVRMIELASVGDDSTVQQAVSDGLGLPDFALLAESGSQAGPFDRIAAQLADSQMVIVLDNCEHLIEAAAQFADRVLRDCPGVRILATSREPLGITGEVLYAIPPLAVPPPDGPADPLEFAAVQLFTERAVAVLPGFTCNPGNAADIAEICRQLDGLPLAIELAAARVRTLSPADIADRLSNRFALLTKGERTAPARHQTLRAVIEWSWDLLTDDERTLAARFAVFAGGATLADIEGVCSEPGLDSDSILGILDALVDKSFIDIADGRYRMLETIRVYSVEQFQQLPESLEISRQHYEYFLDVAESASPHLRTSDQLVWIAKLSAARDNLFGALRWSVEAADPDRAMRLMAAMAWWLTLLGEHNEIKQLMLEVLDLPGGREVSQARAFVLVSTAINATVTGENAHGEDLIARAADVIDQLRSPDPLLMVSFTVASSFIAAERGDQAEADRLIADALPGPDDWSRATLLMSRGMLRENSGDLAAMEVDMVEAHRLFTEVGDRWGLAITSGSLAGLREMEGDYEGARAAYEEAASFNTLLGVSSDNAFLLVRLASQKARMGDYEGARATLRELTELESPSQLALLFVESAYADISRREGNLAEARAIVQRTLDKMAALPKSKAPDQMVSVILSLAAAVEVDDGNRDVARGHAAEAIRRGLRSLDMPVAGIAVEAMAYVEFADGNLESTAALLACARRIRGAPNNSPESQEILQKTTEALGGKRMNEIFTACEEADRDDALKFATETGSE